MNRLVATVVLAAVAFLPSCAGSRKPVYPVTGHVYLKQKPVAGATVIFHPVHAAVNDTSNPVGQVAADGSFKLTTYTNGDGAPEGDYVVTIEWRAPKRNPLEANPVDRLRGRYSDPKTSTLRARVDRQTVELQPIDLGARR